MSARRTPCPTRCLLLAQLQVSAKPAPVGLPKLAGKWCSTGRRAERLNALVEELSKQTEVHGLVVDVRDRQGMEAAIAGLPPAFAKLRGLINNAGLAVGTDPAPKCNLDAGKPWSTPTSRAC